jgi:hypothetical protein
VYNARYGDMQLKPNDVGIAELNAARFHAERT